MTNKQENKKNKKKVTRFDLTSKDIIRNFPEYLMDLFFQGKLGDFDFSKREILSDNVNGLTKRKDENRYTDVIMSAYIRAKGTEIKVTGDVLLLFEPHSYKWNEKKEGRSFGQRMYEYMIDATYHHGKNPLNGNRRKVIPIALFYKEAQTDILTTYKEEGLIEFTFYKVNIHELDWVIFKESSNPVAAAFLGLMNHSENDRISLKLTAYKILSRCKEIMQDREKRDIVINAIEELIVLTNIENEKFTKEYKKLLMEDENMAIIKSPIESETLKKTIYKNLKDVGNIKLDEKYENIINNIYDDILLQNIFTEMLLRIVNGADKNSLQELIELKIK